MIFQALKKSTTPSTLLGSSNLTSRAHGTIAEFRPARRLGGKTVKTPNFVAESLTALPHRSPYGMHILSGTPGSTSAFRFPSGNPSTVAFLGVRSKSSGAAFRVQLDEEDEAVNGMQRVEDSAGRSVQEAWMVNLGRGDEKWLAGPRGAEWFTGLAPEVCPGEFRRP